LLLDWGADADSAGVRLYLWFVERRAYALLNPLAKLAD
jgi:hypothetical protein